MTKLHVFQTAGELIAHLTALGATPSVENTAFTELDHGLQCAALLERERPDDVGLQVAGLLHDLAHPWDEIGQPHHAALGAKAIRDLLGDRVAALIATHVAAKRYLVTVDPGYRASLSPDSIFTLATQGGDMSSAEVRAFESQPYGRDAVRLRIADDGAKLPGAVVPGLAHWLAAVRSLA